MHNSFTVVSTFRTWIISSHTTMAHFIISQKFIMSYFPLKKKICTYLEIARIKCVGKYHGMLETQWCLLCMIQLANLREKMDWLLTVGIIKFGRVISDFAPFNNTPFIPFPFIDVWHVANVKLRAGTKGSSINTCLIKNKTTCSFLHLLSQEQYPRLCSSSHRRLRHSWQYKKPNKKKLNQRVHLWSN